MSGRKAAVLLLAACARVAGADRASVAVEVSPVSQYVWRGLSIGNGAVLQTSSTLSYRGAHINAFTNQALTNSTGSRGVLDELDFDLGYDYAKEKATISGGLIRYTFPNTQAASTTELYVGAAVAAPLHPSVRVYAGVGGIRGRYATFDAYRGVALPMLSTQTTWDAVFAAGVGWGSSNHNAAYYGVSRNALADLHPSLALPITHKRWRITPKLGYGMMLAPVLREGPANKVHGFYGSVTVALTI